MPLRIDWRGTRQELVARLRQLVPMFAGRVPDPTGLIREILLSMGVTLLGKIQDAYVTKSEGGTDELGIQWPPLAASTLALRRKDASTKAVAKVASEIKRMPVSRRRQVQIHYHRLLELYQSGNPAGAASRKHALYLLDRIKPQLTAGRYARLHSELSNPLPATKAKKLAIAGAVALILRDTGIMFNSLSPRIDTPDRILRVEPGAIAVGSNVNQFKYHQSRKPRKLKADGTPRLPRRQILPDQDHPVPVEWKRAMADTLKDSLGSRSFWQRFLGSKATVH